MASKFFSPPLVDLRHLPGVGHPLSLPVHPGALAVGGQEDVVGQGDRVDGHRLPGDVGIPDLDKKTSIKMSICQKDRLSNLVALGWKEPGQVAEGGGQGAVDVGGADVDHGVAK